MEEKSPKLEVIEIDLDYLNEVRTSMPVGNSYRDDLYTLVPSIRSKSMLKYLSLNGVFFCVIKGPIDQPYYTFGHVELHNSVVFYESQHSSQLLKDVSVYLKSI